MEADFSWIFLIFFLLIPLSRIVPRLFAKWKNKKNVSTTIQERSFSANFEKNQAPPQSGFVKHPTKDMLVLGELNKGTRIFSNIQKNTGLGYNELDEILDGLEKKGFLKVHQKQGFFGTKVELYLTEKGYKEFNL